MGLKPIPGAPGSSADLQFPAAIIKSPLTKGDIKSAILRIEYALPHIKSYSAKSYLDEALRILRQES